MNTVLWILQIVLCLKFISVAYTHGIRSDRAIMQQGIQKLGAAARPVLSVAAISSFLGAIGLVLPAAIGVITWMTPLAAALLALTMLLSIGFHIACRDKPNVAVSFVLFALAAFVSYGRWALAPL